MTSNWPCPPPCPIFHLTKHGYPSSYWKLGRRSPLGRRRRGLSAQTQCRSPCKLQGCSSPRRDGKHSPSSLSLTGTKRQGLQLSEPPPSSPCLDGCPRRREKPQRCPSSRPSQKSLLACSTLQAEASQGQPWEGRVNQSTYQTSARAPAGISLARFCASQTQRSCPVQERGGARERIAQVGLQSPCQAPPARHASEPFGPPMGPPSSRAGDGRGSPAPDSPP